MGKKPMQMYLPVNLRDFTMSREEAVRKAGEIPGADEGWSTVLSLNLGVPEDYELEELREELKKLGFQGKLPKEDWMQGLKDRLDLMVQTSASGKFLDSDEALAICYFAFMVVNSARVAGNDNLFRQMVQGDLDRMAKDLGVSSDV
jgi:hypothetical protein